MFNAYLALYYFYIQSTLSIELGYNEIPAYIEVIIFS